MNLPVDYTIPEAIFDSGFMTIVPERVFGDSGIFSDIHRLPSNMFLLYGAIECNNRAYTLTKAVSTINSIKFRHDIGITLMRGKEQILFEYQRKMTQYEFAEN